MAGPRVLIASNYNAWREPFNSQSFEFLDVISSIDDADLIAPEGRSYTQGWRVRPTPRFLATDLLLRVASGSQAYWGRPRLPSMANVQVEKDYDLFFYMCQFPNDLANLQGIKGWRKRSGKAAAFILESWSSLFPTTRGELKLLDAFDHVFILNRSSLPKLASYTKTPCSFLATGADCIRATPFPNPVRRDVDVYSMGRRPPTLHEQLLRLMEDEDLFYIYDAWKHGITPDWRSSRLLTMNLIKRSKFFIAYDHTISSGMKIQEAGQERSLSNRYFEGAAGGAVMLGSAPDCAEFRDFFDWEDAVIDFPLDTVDIGRFLNNLRHDPERLHRISHTNAVQALRRFDWSYRWADILATLGLPQTRKLEQRIETLRRLAAEAEHQPIRSVAAMNS